MRLFDTHCHLGDEKLKDSVAELLERAKGSGVDALCVICADAENIAAFDDFIPKIRALNPHVRVYRSAGLHPHEARHWSPEIEKQIYAQLSSDAVAVGETGLDYHYDFSKPEEQKPVFEKHIDWACEFQKPLVIHCREAAPDILSMIDREDMRKHPRPGILHCFTETRTEARVLLDRNFMISFSGIITFNNADEIREVAKMVPADRILVETDSPYLAPKPQRGRSNEPAFVAHTFKFVAELRGEDPEAFAEQVWKNSCRTYGVSAS
ncbi:MAG: TatD family hydrolase [Bdellovibrionota bacterium]